MTHPDELGREGRMQTLQRVSAEKIQKRSALFQATVGVSALALVGAAGLASYAYYTATVHTPEYTEQYQKQVDIARQEKIANEQAESMKKTADQAIERARLETEAAKKAAKESRPNELLEKMFQRTNMTDVICMPRDLQLTAQFNSKGDVTSFNKSYSLNLGRDIGHGSDVYNEALQECKTNFSDVDFSAPRSLGAVPGIAHYAQLKDMWALCRNGFENPDSNIKLSSDGSGSGYYRLYAGKYNFSDVADYQSYQTCMKAALNDPFIATGASTPVAGLQP